MDEYKKAIGVPENHNLVLKPGKPEQKKGQDADVYFCDEVDENGNVVAKYILRDATSIYPPFRRTITFDKVG